MKTSLAQLRAVGASSTELIVGQTMFLAGLVLLGVLVWGKAPNWVGALRQQSLKYLA